MEEFNRDHLLWVNLSSLREGNIFTILPQLMKSMLSEDMAEKDNLIFDVILPSDDAWQTKIYYKLVEKQRLADSTPRDESMLDPLMRDTPLAKLHDWDIYPKQRQISLETKPQDDQKKTKKLRGIAPITWTVSDISKAGSLLSNPPQPTSFEDEQEMRRVYTLIYDVFRYKSVLNQALNDIGFFQIFPTLVQTIPQVWLLLYDLYHRIFKKRETKIAPIAGKLFDAVGMTYAENALWTQKVKLAAAVARLRIQHNALCLSELLPPHLKDERVTELANTNPVTCWVNSLKVRDISNLCQDLEQTFSLKMVHENKRIGRNNFKWDRHCPLIMVFHASMRSKLARSPFVRDHVLIVQDKSFCLGPATFGKLIADLELTGNVIQTHVNSPRTTAYLATLLAQNEKVKNLMAFSAGKRKPEYENYFTQLGMTNICIYSDRLIDTPKDANYMEEVVGVFATPPNSYSAIIDPIDLICSRGGDISMLEILTETGDSKEARERIAGVLEEQRRTLKFAMSRPQIQFVIYETHSELESENEVMIDKAMKEINKIARIKHATQKSPELQTTNQEYQIDLKEINNNEKLPVIDEDKEMVSTESRQSVGSGESDQDNALIENINVPDTDIFDCPVLPCLCPSDGIRNYVREGCYLALLKRRKVIRLDDKYMIQMAENRGLFGSNTTTATTKSKTSRAQKKKLDAQVDKSLLKPRRKIRDSEIDRIAAPTHTFLRHTKHIHEIKLCRKLEFEEDKKSKYRQWWIEAAHHILSLKQYFVRQKKLPSQRIRHVNPKSIVDSWVYDVSKIDELVAAYNLNARFPVFPRLRLTRINAQGKIQIPMHVTSVEFPVKRMFVESQIYLSSGNNCDFKF